MYSLTLTHDERAAIDWVGYRYSHGDRLYALLCQADGYGPPIMWDDEPDITFKCSERIAWEIQEIGEECDYRWDCFSEELASKLNKFCDEIV